MPEIPQFFVPAAETSKEAEDVYKSFAEWCDQSPLPMKQRIFSITFRHDGTEWTATVGEKLSGTMYKMIGKGINKREIQTPTSDPAVVLAIFPGDSYLVVTNHKIAGSVGSAWVNPFLAGRPTRVVLFAP